MQTGNLNDYINYFRSLAVSHNEIAHNPASEIGMAPPSQKKFATWSVDEVIGGLRSEMGFPALLLQIYETELSANSELNINNSTTGAFTIVMDAINGEIGSEHSAYALCEKIMYELLQQIHQDHYSEANRNCSSPFKEFYFDKIDITPTGKIFTSHFGYHCEFSFSFRTKLKIGQPVADGLFSNYTILGTPEFYLGNNGAYLGIKL